MTHATAQRGSTTSPGLEPAGLCAVILAAGKGTRMKSDLPKVVHPVGGRPMVCAVVDACRAAGATRIIVVVGYQQEKVREALKGFGVEFALQGEQLGTGHAVMSAAGLLKDLPAGTPVLVLAGDGPLIRPDTIRGMLDTHRRGGASATMATSVLNDPTGYGRIIRDGSGRFRAIVEHKHCTPEQLNVREVNPSYYCFEVASLLSALARVKRNEGSGEYYITDVPGLLLAEGRAVEVVGSVPAEDVLSINTPEELSKVDAIYRARGSFAPKARETPREGSAMTNGSGVSTNGELKLFAGRSCRHLAGRVAAHMGVPLGSAKTSVFPDGEVLVKLDEDVRGRDCFVLLSTCEPVNDNLMELLVYIDCLKRASAARVTCVIPYFGYARQDRKDEGRVPITAKLVANLITKAGADRVLAVDLHAAQIQGFFDLPVDHLSATPVFVEHFNASRPSLGNLCLVSPDVGNVKVAETMANLLGGDLAIINKRRLSGSAVTTGNLIGTVEGKTVLMFDDMISTAGTVVEAARLVLDKGATQVIAAATHGVLVGPALERLAGDLITKVVVTNTIPSGREDGADRLAPIRGKTVELCVGALIGEAILRIHDNRSVSELFKKTAGVKR
ncbi:MAG: ribose-phosphate diphosphokinase [Phycisphaeraceae bacterium]|nr:MAG: ribose-phosphate diphosphokinase [Phycisphaeraceae bacterium]